MLTPGKAGLRGILAGSVASALLVAAYWAWTHFSPRAYEGAYDTITTIAYLLGFPVSFGLDHLFAAIEAAGPKYVVSTLAIALVSLPLNWSLIGVIQATVRTGKGKPTAV